MLLLLCQIFQLCLDVVVLDDNGVKTGLQFHVIPLHFGNQLILLLLLHEYSMLVLRDQLFFIQSENAHTSRCSHLPIAFRYTPRSIALPRASCCLKFFKMKLSVCIRPFRWISKTSTGDTHHDLVTKTLQLLIQIHGNLLFFFNLRRKFHFVVRELSCDFNILLLLYSKIFNCRNMHGYEEFIRC